MQIFRVHFNRHVRRDLRGKTERDATTRWFKGNFDNFLLRLEREICESTLIHILKRRNAAAFSIFIACEIIIYDREFHFM